MIIENEFEVNAPVDKVWAYLLDVPNLAPCLPGAELVGSDIDGDGNGTYQGEVTTKLGPVKMKFTGTAKITETDEAARRIVMSAAGSEVKGKGTANMTVTSTLVAVGRGTKVKVHQDLQVSGAAAQFGRGMIADVTSVLMKSFADCIQHNIDNPDIGNRGSGGAGTVVAAKPASGIAIGMRAALMALKRVFGRLFGGGK